MIDTKYTCDGHSVTVLADDGFHIFGTVCGHPGVWIKSTGEMHPIGYRSPLVKVAEHTYRPWTAADVPWPWPVIRYAVQHENMFAITFVCDTGINIGGVKPGDSGFMPWKHCQMFLEYTTDGKTWLPCRKETAPWEGA